MTSILLELVANLDLSEDRSKFDKLRHIYRQPAPQGHFTIKDDILYMKERFKNDVKFVDLRIVPSLLHHIIFIALPR